MAGRVQHTKNKVLDTIINNFGAAEGALMPPPQRGQFRVPFVTGLRVQQSTQFVGGTQFILTFNEPTHSNRTIDHYNIFVGGLTGNTLNYNGPNTCLASPAVVRVQTTAAQTVIFKVQTVLSSGLVSDIDASPTCTGTTIPATITPSDIPDGSLDIIKLAAQAAGSLLEWNAAGDPALLAPVAAGRILASTTTSTPPTYQTKASLDLVLGNSNLGTAGRVPFVSAAGTLNEDTHLLYDATNKVAKSDWLNWNGQLRVATQFDKVNTTLATVTGLSVTVIAGRTYEFEAFLHLTLDATGGAKVAIAGSATATSIIYETTILDNTTNAYVVTDRKTALAGASSTAGTTAGVCRIKGLITVNAGGTLLVQFAQSAANNTSSILVGSTFIVNDII